MNFQTGIQREIFCRRNSGGNNQTESVALIDVGNRLYMKGRQADAMHMYESALQVLRTESPANNYTHTRSHSHVNTHTQEHKAALEEAVLKQLEWGTEKLQLSNEDFTQPNEPDTYHEDECDVGPRPFRSAMLPDFEVFNDGLGLNQNIEACIMYNTALAHQSSFDYDYATPLYERVLQMATKDLEFAGGLAHQEKLLDLCMRSHNNLGHIRYVEASEDQALSHFEAALSYARQMTSPCTEKQLDCATVLSNWCRVEWMRGNMSGNLHKALGEVLRIRFSILGWNHTDVASAHYNLGVAEYARLQNEKATSHLMQYLHVVSHRLNNSLPNDLDPIPALIYILLMKNEESEDNMAQELVRGLRTLQEKRHDLGPNNFEVASVLNFVGTLLFHQRDFENALIFFREEPRLEETLIGSEDVSVSVTCNNMGRIFQELGRLPDAVVYYHRALKSEYGDDIKKYKPSHKGESGISKADPNTKDLSLSTMNLYSTIWYNLGLIHDKLGSYVEAINSFQKSLGLRKVMLGPDHADVACLLYNIGVLQMEQQMLPDATASFREALRIRRVVATGQLNDQHVVKTLQKLSSLHKSKGNIDGSLEALREILIVQENSKDMKLFQRRQGMGSTLREIAELHHAQGDIKMALQISQQSVEFLKPSSPSETINEIYCAELVSALLLLGSLSHENSEPTVALNLFMETVTMIDRTVRDSNGPSPLDALREVSCMLATSQCAPVA